MSESSVSTKEKMLKIAYTLYYKNIFTEFRRPVAIEYDSLAEEYLGIISNPMDLGSIIYQIETDEVTSIHTFRDNLMLVINNCIKFNEDKPYIQEKSRNLYNICEGLYEEEFHEFFNDHEKKVSLLNNLMNKTEQKEENLQQIDQQTNEDEMKLDDQSSETKDKEIQESNNSTVDSSSSSSSTNSTEASSLNLSEYFIKRRRFRLEQLKEFSLNPTDLNFLLNLIKNFQLKKKFNKIIYDILVYLESLIEKTIVKVSENVQENKKIEEIEEKARILREIEEKEDKEKEETEVKEEEEIKEETVIKEEIDSKDNEIKDSIGVDEIKNIESKVADVSNTKKETKKKAPSKKVVKKNIWKPVEVNKLNHLKSITIPEILSLFSSIFESEITETEEVVQMDGCEEEETKVAEENDENYFNDDLTSYLGNYPSFLNFLNIKYLEYKKMTPIMKKNLKEFDDMLGFFLIHFQESICRGFLETTHWSKPYDKCVWVQKLSKDNKNRNTLLPALVVYSSSEKFKIPNLINQSNLKRFPEKTVLELSKVRPRISGSSSHLNSNDLFFFTSPYISLTHSEVLTSFSCPPNYMIIEYLKTREIAWVKEENVHDVYPSTSFPFDKVIKGSSKKDSSESGSQVTSSLPNEKVLMELNYISKLLEKVSSNLYDYSILNNDKDLDFNFQLQSEDNKFLVEEILSMKNLSRHTFTKRQKKLSTNDDSISVTSTTNSSSLKRNILMKIKKNPNEIIDSTGKVLTSRISPSKLIPNDFYTLLGKLNYNNLIAKNKFSASKVPLPSQVYYENLPFGIISKNGLNLRRNTIVRTRAFVNWLTSKKPLVFNDLNFSVNNLQMQSNSEYIDEDEEVFFLNSSSSSANDHFSETFNVVSGKNNRIQTNFNNRKFEYKLDFNNFSSSSISSNSQPNVVSSLPNSTLGSPVTATDQNDLSDLKLLDSNSNILKYSSGIGLITTRTINPSLFSNFFSASSLVSPMIKKDYPPTLPNSASILLFKESLNPIVRKKLLKYELSTIQQNINILENNDDTEENEYFFNSGLTTNTASEQSKNKGKKRNISSSPVSVDESNSKIQKIEI